MSEANEPSSDGGFWFHTKEPVTFFHNNITRINTASAAVGALEKNRSARRRLFTYRLLPIVLNMIARKNQEIDIVTIEGVKGDEIYGRLKIDSIILI